MSVLQWLLSPLRNSAYIQDLISEHTEHLRLELQRVDEFLKAYNHDLADPIHGMKAALQLLEGVQDSKDLVFILDAFSIGCKLLEDIQNNMRDFLDSYVDSTYAQDIVLANWLPPIVDLYRPLAKVKNIQITLDIGHDAAFTFNSDKLKLTRAISNLIANAIKYTPKGKAVAIRTYSKLTQLYIEIQDEGVGIPADKLNVIFLPYVRLDETAPGLGIGLSICKRAIEQLLGHVRVASVVSEGSVFTVILPQSLHKILTTPYNN